MIRMARELWKDEAGVSTVEYALLLGVLVVGAGVAWTVLTSAISAAITDVADTLS